MMYEDMLENNYSRVLIMEDDAVPDPKMIEQIPAILSEIPADCEVLMWGWDKNGESNLLTAFKKIGYNFQHVSGLLKWDHIIIENLFAKPFSPHLKKSWLSRLYLLLCNFKNCSGKIDPNANTGPVHRR